MPSNATRQAMANLLPLLICGEESATLVFDALAVRLRKRLSEPQLRELLTITQDEERHARMLYALRDQLPCVQSNDVEQRASAFLASLASRHASIQLARLCALDAAVCWVLARLLHGSPALTQQSDVIHMLRQIRQDEARHVRITRDCALSLGLSSDELAAQQHTVWLGFAELLAGSSDDLRVLGVEPAVLLARFRGSSGTQNSERVTAASIPKLHMPQIAIQAPMFQASMAA